MDDGVYDQRINKGDNCIAVPPREFCQGDLGGPFVCNINGKAIVLGVIADSVTGNYLIFSQ